MIEVRHADRKETLWGSVSLCVDRKAKGRRARGVLQVLIGGNRAKNKGVFSS